MKTKKIIKIYFILLIISACSNIQETKHYKVETITVPEDYNKHLITDSLIESFKIVPLETNKNCLITEIQNIIVFNEKYYIYDRMASTIFVFNKKGKFIFKLDKKGKGPGEYIKTTDFRVDENGDLLVLTRMKMIRYDSKGNYINTNDYSHNRTEKNGFAPSNFVPLKNGGYYFWTGDFGQHKINNLEHYAISKVDKNNDLVSKELLMKRSSIRFNNVFYKYAPNAYYMQSIKGNDTIYSISDKGVIPAYFVNFGNKSIPPDYLPNKFDGMGKIYFEISKTTDYSTTINNITESNQYLYFRFNSHSKYYEALYSKNSNSVKVGRLFTYPTSLGINNYDQSTDEYISIMNDNIIAMLMAERNKFEKKYSKTDKKIINYIDSVDDKFNNPFLVTYKLKNF